VGKKANLQRVGLAMDALSRQILTFHVGDRCGQSAHAVWGKNPIKDQEQARFSTDCDEVYKEVSATAQPRAITRLARTTNHVERFHCPLRQRVSRLARATLSFSKKLANHIGAINYFLCDSNLTKCVALPG